MGSLCCYNVPPHSVEAETQGEAKFNPLAQLMACSDHEEPLSGISYSQRRIKGVKRYCNFGTRRLLAYTAGSVYMLRCPSSHLADQTDTRPVQILQQSERLVFCSFVNDHKSDCFATISESNGKFTLRSYTINESAKTLPALVAEPAPRPVKSVRSSQHLNELRPSVAQDTVLARKSAEQELTPCEHKRISCAKMIRNIACNHAELLLATDSDLVTVTLKNADILRVYVQSIDKKFANATVIGIEYWVGYYFVLFSNNVIEIYKREITGTFVTVKTLTISAKHELRIRQMKVPVLEWSDRLVDVLQKEFPLHILLVGDIAMEDKTYQCLVKYNVKTQGCENAVAFDNDVRITCLNYGPYDNGPATLGFSDGTVMFFDYYTLKRVLQFRPKEKDEVMWITHEPCRKVFIGGRTAVYSYSLTDDVRALAAK